MSVYLRCIHNLEMALASDDVASAPVDRYELRSIPNE